MKLTDIKNLALYETIMVHLWPSSTGNFFCKRPRPNLGCTYHIYGRQIHFTNNFLTGHILAAAAASTKSKKNLKFETNI